MRKLLFYVIAALMSSCTVYNGPTVDDLYQSGPRDRQVYVDPDRGYMRMRTTSSRWRTFDEDFYYWNFGPGLVGVGNPMGGWNTWRWYSPGFPVYGTPTWMPYSIYGGPSPWVPYSIYGGWGIWPPHAIRTAPWGHTNAWTPYREVRQAPQSPRQFNLGAYRSSPRIGSSSPTRTFGSSRPVYQPGAATQGAGSGNTRNGSPTRTFSVPPPANQPRTGTQGSPATTVTRPGSAPVRKFNRP
jgi:hypothetical protein